MIYATSDLHGYPLSKFQALLDKAGFGDDDFLFILGDVIDRNGDGGIAALEWIMEQPNIQLLLGNHEAMLLKCSFLFDEITDAALDNLQPEQMSALLRWMSNGAEPTMDALARLNPGREDAGDGQDVEICLIDADGAPEAPEAQEDAAVYGGQQGITDGRQGENCPQQIDQQGTEGGGQQGGEQHLPAQQPPSQQK